MAKQRAVIIGAGLAGLALALRLAESGRYEPVLLERGAEAGGLARTLHFGEFATDIGPHRIHSENPEILRFIRELAAPSLLMVPRSSHMYLGGGFLRYPPDPLGLAARVGPLRLAHFAASFALERLRPPARPETYESLMRRTYGPALYNYLLHPFSAKTWKSAPAQIHADVARVRITTGNLTQMVRRLLGGRTRGGPADSLKEFSYVRGGAGTLVKHFREKAEAAGARVELGAEAERIELDGAGRAVAVAARRGGEALRFPADIVASTVPLPRLLDTLLPPAPFLAGAREAAAGLAFLDVILVCLIVRRPRLSNDNWLYFPEKRFIFNRAYEAKNFDPSMAPEGRTILCLEITHRQGEAPPGGDDEALIATVGGQIAATGLLNPQEIERGVVARIPYAYPLYTLDYGERVERTLAGLEQVGNLITLGRQGLFIHNNMDHSIEAGLAAGELLGKIEADEAAVRWRGELERLKDIRIVD